MRFGKKWMLSSLYVRPFEVIEWIGEVAYQLAPLLALLNLHDVFYVSMLKKYLYDPSHVLSYKSLDVDPKLTYEEKPIKILNKKDKMLRIKTMPLVKVLRLNHAVEEVTRETEAEIQKSYPELFWVSRMKPL